MNRAFAAIADAVRLCAKSPDTVLLCAMYDTTTTETQRTQRYHREDLIRHARE